MCFEMLRVANISFDRFSQEMAALRTKGHVICSREDCESNRRDYKYLCEELPYDFNCNQQRVTPNTFLVPTFTEGPTRSAASGT